MQGQIERIEGIIADYNEYKMSLIEYLLNFLVASVVIVFVLKLFYGYWLVGLLGTPLSVFFVKARRKSIIAKRKQRLTEQFKEMLYALSGCMQAGKSLETAFSDIYSDLQIMYPNPQTEIMIEIKNIIANINIGTPLEMVLQDFANRTQDEEIQTFVDVYQTTKLMGGNLIQVIKNTSNTISEKIEVKQEIQLAVAAAKFEHKVLLFVPVGVILMIQSISPDYMEKLYGNILGIVVATVAIVMFAIAYVVGDKITDINI